MRQALFFTDALTACCQKRKEKIKPEANEVSDRLLFAVKPNSRSRPMPQSGRGSNLTPAKKKPGMSAANDRLLP